MGNLVVFWDFVLIALTWSTLLTYTDAQLDKYRYVVTEDILPGTLGKVYGPPGFSQSIFSLSGSQRYVTVHQRTGILQLRRKLTTLPKDVDGIRRLTVAINVEAGHRDYPVRNAKLPEPAIIVELVIFPYNFGDTLLRRFGGRLRRGIVRRSHTFPRGDGGPNILHRFLRNMSPKVESKAFREAFSAIKVRKVIKLAVIEILKEYVPLAESETEFHFWALNSLFSQNALSQLAVSAGCEQEKSVRCPTNRQFRSMDGTCNNLQYPLYGSAPHTFSRLLPARYFDAEGLNDPIGAYDQPLAPHVPSPFEVEREFLQKHNKPRTREIFSHAVMQWGQWLDHDLDLSPESQSSDNCQNVPCDGSREDFAPPCYTILPIPNYRCIRFARTASKCQIKNGRITVREQLNINTAFIDGSQLYGSSLAMSNQLRDFTNDIGLLKRQPGVTGDLLVADNSGLFAPNNFCDRLGGCFLSGDSRSSETTLLAATHIMFLREHNRVAWALKNINPHWNGERVYQETRKICGGVLQKITYDDYLPILIGNTLPAYRGYDPKTDPGVLNSFATAAYRFGHSTIRPTFDILNSNYDPIGDPLPLRHLFFNNTFIKRFGIDPLMLGLLGNASEKVDRTIASELLEKLFERPHHPGLNLAALNIQRGRDHGLPGYNAFRRYCGFKDARTFEDTRREIPDAHNRRILARLYNDDPELADLWPTGLAEAPANGGIVGPTFGCIIREQMRRFRDGDSFFYKRPGVFTRRQLQEIEKTSLSRIMCDNLQSIVSIQRNAFLAGNGRHRRVECSQIPGTDLRAWKEH